MADRCPHCGVALAAPSPDACPACLKSLAADTGITTTPAPGLAGSFAEGTPLEAPLPSLEGDGPSIVKPGTTGPACPAWLLVTLSTGLCGMQGAATHLGMPGGIAAATDEIAFGAVVGFVIGVGLAIDNWFFQRKLSKPAILAADDDGESRVPVARPHEWISLAMLILPIVAGVVLWFAVPLRLTRIDVSLIGSGTIVATAVLGYFSIRQMALRADRNASYQGNLSSPAYTYVSMLFFWLILYPVHFVSRWRMGGKNLIVPGLIATAVYCAHIGQGFVVDAELPPVDDGEALALVRQIVEDEPKMKPVTIRNPVEVSFDPALQKRVGRGTISTKFGEEPVSYQINWQNRKTGIWQVQVFDRLPFVDAPEVLELVKNILQENLRANGRIRLDPVVLRNPVQIGYDAPRQQRTGQASASAGRGNANITYVIFWADPDRKMFNVQVNGNVP